MKLIRKEQIPGKFPSTRLPPQEVQRDVALLKKTGIEKEVEENIKGSEKTLGEIRGCLKKIRRKHKI